MKEKHDHAFINDRCSQIFHHVLTQNLVSTNSDHYLILVELGEQWEEFLEKEKVSVRRLFELPAGGGGEMKRLEGN